MVRRAPERKYVATLPSGLVEGSMLQGNASAEYARYLLQTGGQSLDLVLVLLLSLVGLLTIQST